MRVFVSAMNNKRSWMAKMKLVFNTYRYVFLLLFLYIPYGYVHRTANILKMVPKWNEAQRDIDELRKRKDTVKENCMKVCYGGALAVFRVHAVAISFAHARLLIAMRARYQPQYNKNGNIGNQLEMLKWSLLNDEEKKNQKLNEHTRTQVCCMSMCATVDRISAVSFSVFLPRKEKKIPTIHVIVCVVIIDESRCIFNRFERCPWCCFWQMVFG